ncbi:MAG: S8 family serine peptidase [Bacteroidales bacterium]|nr:S8 family serine peptidase [Bacteroidales bacterium]
MATKKLIYSADLQEYRPLIWYGEPVYARYTQLENILNNGLGATYAELLTEPIVINGNARWMSAVATNAVPFPKLDAQKQENARVNLQVILNKIKNLANELQQNEDPHQKELGELLLLSIEVPSLDCVYVDGNRIILVAWGFSNEESKKINFKLDTKIDKPVGMADVAIGTTLSVPTTSTENVSVPPTTSTTTNNVNTQSTTPPPPQPEGPKTQSTTPPTPPPPTNNNNKKGLPGWLWFLLGVLITVIIVLLLWFLLGKDDNNNNNNNANNNDGNKSEYLPDNPGIVPPIDTTRVIVDPDDPGQRLIFSDKVNIALKKGSDINNFANILHQQYENKLQIVYYDTAILLMQVETPEGEWKQWRDTLKNMPDVRLAFSNTIFSSEKKMSDPAFNDAKKAWYFDVIQAYKAWDVTQGDSSVIVAIVDNGFDISHPEIKDKVVMPYDITKGSSHVTPCGGEGNEHGTHVAGTAVGGSNNGQGLCGIAPNCKLMPIKIGDDYGNMQTISIVAGILYAIHHNAKVVNLSLGTYFGEEVTSLPNSEQSELAHNYYTEEADFWNELFQFGLEEDVILVLAAGNQNIMAGIDPFSRSNKVMVVSAYESARTPKADFSNHGEFTNISAPGVEIYSCVPGNKFEMLQGTSMASPIVTGACALMRSAHPEMKAEEIVSAIKNTAKPLNNNPKIGPLLQIFDALNYKGDLLEIPDDAKDLSFAQGKWKSTTDLYSESDSVDIQLIFEIKTDGNGEITYAKSTGHNFFADLNITFSDGKLIMKQTEDALNEKYPDEGFMPYVFTCQQDKQEGCAKCKAEADGKNLVDFNMKKID